MYDVILTVGDHEQNGFVHLAKWRFSDEDTARAFIVEQDARVPPEAEPDHKTEPFTFTLDLMAGPCDMIAGGKRNLPMQNAMALAPEQVRRWLEVRPDPDAVSFRPIPILVTAHD